MRSGVVWANVAMKATVLIPFESGHAFRHKEGIICWPGLSLNPFRIRACVQAKSHTRNKVTMQS